MFLQGKTAKAHQAYEQANELQKKLHNLDLYHQRGVQFATVLLQLGEDRRARELTEKNLVTAEKYRWIRIISQCHRLLGELDARAKRQQEALTHFDQAVQRSRQASHLPALIEALLARGCWFVSSQQIHPARTDLEEALTYAVDGDYTTRGDVTLRYADAGGYNVYEADIRIALGRVFVSTGDIPAARAQIGRGSQISEEIGYRSGILAAQSF
jgi:tetratricopeptide (TPR) repeat protein